MTRLPPCTLAWLLFVPALLPAQEDPAAAPARAEQQDSTWKSLFDGTKLEGWEAPKGFFYERQGKLALEDGALILPMGQPASGVRWTGQFPRTNYEVELEGKRVDGYDFFCGLSFPVGDGALTLILGGWGGTVVGLSSIDGYRAIDNETCNSVEFKNDRWYRIRVRVTDQEVIAWVDDKVVCEIKTTGRRLSVTDEMAPCLPLGIATWNTTGALRGIRYRQWSAEAEPQQP
jgi:hypothetical protein